MTYKLKFVPAALKEWDKLAPNLKQQFKKKLAERLEEPHIISAKLSGYESVYKIKLRSAGYRLVYEVQDDVLVVFVLAVGQRENGSVYKNVSKRV